MSSTTPLKLPIAAPADLPPDLGSMGYIRAKSLLRVIPISKATLWRWVSDGAFPKPLKLSANVTAWRVEDVRQWLAQHPELKSPPARGQLPVKESP